MYFLSLKKVGFFAVSEEEGRGDSCVPMLYKAINGLFVARVGLFRVLSLHFRFVTFEPFVLQIFT